MLRLYVFDTVPHNLAGDESEAGEWSRGICVRVADVD